MVHFLEGHNLNGRGGQCVTGIVRRACVRGHGRTARLESAAAAPTPEEPERTRPRDVRMRVVGAIDVPGARREYPGRAPPGRLRRGLAGLAGVVPEWPEWQEACSLGR